jgi:hypothetical protein
MDGPKDKIKTIELAPGYGPSGQENVNRKADPDAMFWHSLGKQVAHGPAVRIRDGVDARRRMPRS